MSRALQDEGVVGIVTPQVMAAFREAYREHREGKEYLPPLAPDFIEPAIKAAISAILPSTIGGSEPWACAECGCKTHARCDERKPDGKFGPGPMVRCVNCKAVSVWPPVPTEGSVGVSEAMVATVWRILDEANPDAATTATVRKALTAALSPAISGEPPYEPTILRLGEDYGDPYWQFVLRDVATVTSPPWVANVETLTDFDGNLIGFNIYEPASPSIQAQER